VRGANGAQFHSGHSRHLRPPDSPCPCSLRRHA
jgi:hypothetical protein